MPAPASKAPPLRQRLTARALVASKRAADGRSTLDRLEQDGSAKVRLPRSADAALTAVTLNTAGGLTGGDRIAWQAVAGEGSRLTVASAACEKLYRTHGPPAEQSTRLDVAANARLDWLPQETIVFDGARLHRRLDATLAAGARLLVAEALVLGGCTALATVLYCEDGPPESLERLVATLHALIEGAPTGVLGGASALDGRLVLRLAASSGFDLRQALLPCLAVLLESAPVPHVWHV